MVAVPAAAGLFADDGAVAMVGASEEPL